MQYKPLRATLRGVFIIHLPHSPPIKRITVSRRIIRIRYPVSPLSARLFPRLARTQKPRFFVQMCSPAKATPRLGWRGKSTIKKIVHYRADLCGDFAAGVFTSKQAKLRPYSSRFYTLFSCCSRWIHCLRCIRICSGKMSKKS